MHLKLGYERWRRSRAEWEKSGKKPLMFVMCEDTKAADDITKRLNGDEVFKELNGRTINLHTNLKGKIKRVGGREVFVESEKEISDEDLKALRKLSRELDSGTSPYFCIEIAIPRLTAAAQTLATLSPITEEEVREAFRAYKPLPIGARGPDEVPYEGRHLITGEVVERMKVNLALLESGVGALSFYVQELEYVGKVKGTHTVLAPLLQVFFEQILFGPGHSVFDPALVARLSESDVREHVRAVFVPLIRRKTLRQQVRRPGAPPVLVSTWRPFQVSASERKPVLKSERTLFNLVPCNRSLEQALVEFLGKANDVTAFAKNAGPQALRIDFLADGQRLAFYTPDFFVRNGARRSSIRPVCHRSGCCGTALIMH